MNPTPPLTRVGLPPAKPLVIYDGDCTFCTLWIGRWRQISRDGVDYLPLQDHSVSERFPELPREALDSAVHLIEPDGSYHCGARAAFGAVAGNASWRWLLAAYQKWPGFAVVAEWGYGLVARNRRTFSRLTRLGWGNHVEQPAYLVTRAVFLRGLALVYLVAFLSLWSQIQGLVGERGITPVSQLMQAATRHFATADVGIGRFRLLPTLCWFDASERFLNLHCAAGSMLAVLVLAGVSPAICLFLLWLIYLSLTSVCGVFLGFQWDALLLETGFLAIFFAPLRLWPTRRAQEAEWPPSRLVLWLLRLLLFKLMFQSGCVKLVSADATWREMTALVDHYATQPLPTWIGWYAHQLPLWFQKLSCLLMFGIELVIPFLFFAPRRLRAFAAATTAVLMVIIMLTGNYTFFNWLTLVLCIALLDDFLLVKLIPSRFRSKGASTAFPQPGRWRRLVTIPLSILVGLVTLVQLFGTFRTRPAWLTPAAAVHQWLAPLRSVNSYGLFAVMTTSRPEIIIEGSDDGVTWQTYEFKHKPADLKRPPGFVAPHQPRLDWQMWFAALGTARDNPWFVNFCVRLLEGSPEVTALLYTNPFPARPPRYIRARLFDYRFTSFAERRATGDWWKREERGLYLPPISLPPENR